MKQRGRRKQKWEVLFDTSPPPTTHDRNPQRDPTWKDLILNDQNI